MIWLIKRKSSIHSARAHGERKKHFVGQPIWTSGISASHGGPGRKHGLEIHLHAGSGEEDKRVVHLKM